VPVVQAAGDVTLDVAISPLSAKVFLDDRPLGANPFHGQLAKDGKEHVLRAEAAGFKPRAFSFVLDRDRAIDFTLEGYAVGGRGAAPVATVRAATGASGKRGDPATPTSEPTGMRELPLKDHDTPKPQLDTDVFRKP
jgi:serine/threonine-protein kinase